MVESLRWDIFCHVVDNLGDIGVSWRLAAQLAARGQAVRLWVDDASALAWMAPDGCAGVQVMALPDAEASFEAGQVLIQAFGCPLAPAVLAAMARANRQAARSVIWINLEYLSAEAFVARSHGLESPVHGGAPAGMRRWFYFPGFSADTGGLLREAGLMERRLAFERAAWFARRGISWAGETVVSLFCYEPAGLGAWLATLAGTPTLLLVTAGRAAAAVRQALAGLPAALDPGSGLRVVYLPYLSQSEFDQLLWSADCNFVRGEDSLVRALWAGAGLVWQPYPQQDGAHRVKLDAFLEWLQAPPSLRRFHGVWNGFEAGPGPALQCSGWRAVVDRARQRLLEQDDLVSRLFQFIAKTR